MAVGGAVGVDDRHVADPHARSVHRESLREVLAHGGDVVAVHQVVPGRDRAGHKQVAVLGFELQPHLRQPEGRAEGDEGHRPRHGAVPLGEPEHVVGDQSPHRMGGEQHGAVPVVGQRLAEPPPGGVPEGPVVMVAPEVVQAVFEDRVVHRREADGLLQAREAAVDPVGEGRLPAGRLAGGGGERPEAEIGGVGLPVVAVPQGLGVAQVRPVDEIEGDRPVAPEVAGQPLADRVDPPPRLFLAGGLVGQSVDADDAFRDGRLPRLGRR